MGCIQSKPLLSMPTINIKPTDYDAAKSYVKKILKHRENLDFSNKKSSLKKLDLIEKPRTIDINTTALSFSMKYCYVSQRGYYPESPDKANQDSYQISENVLNDKNCHLFGIYDGHGEFGDLCSYHAATKFMVNCQAVLFMNCKQLKQVNKLTLPDTSYINSLEIDNIEEIFTKMFDLTNVSLRKSHVDDSASGTTAVNVLMCEDVLYACNVGDSRVIIASEVDGDLKFCPLSSDQTPYRRDERERLKKCGAVIRTVNQIEGLEPIHENWENQDGNDIDETGDPPRVWNNTLEIPGCAFTRSIGDAIAEKIGVNAVPEIVRWKLESNDKFIVIASDGVFEFLTSQNVVDIIAQYDDIVKAAKFVVEEAYRLWLMYDDRTDDISIIIISIEDFKRKAVRVIPAKSLHINVTDYASNKNTAIAELLRISPMASAKPVRRVMSKRKRNEVIENWIKFSYDTEDDFESSYDVVPKSIEEMNHLFELSQWNYVLQNLTPVHLSRLFQVMQYRSVASGEVVFREGDPGDCMFIIDSGEYQVSKKDLNGVEHELKCYTTPGRVFGELSLIFDKPRSATITALVPGNLYILPSKAFRSILKKRKSDDLMNTVKSIPVICRLFTYQQIQRLCEGVVECEYQDSEQIETASIDRTKSSGNHRSNCISQESMLRIESTDGNTDTKEEWLICIVLAGQIRLFSTASTPTASKPLRYFSKTTFLINPNLKIKSASSQTFRLVAYGKTIVSYITKSCIAQLLYTRAVTFDTINESFDLAHTMHHIDDNEKVEVIDEDSQIKQGDQVVISRNGKGSQSSQDIVSLFIRKLVELNASSMSAHASSESLYVQSPSAIAATSGVVPDTPSSSSHASIMSTQAGGWSFRSVNKNVGSFRTARIAPTLVAQTSNSSLQPSKTLKLKSPTFLGGTDRFISPDSPTLRNKGSNNEKAATAVESTIGKLQTPKDLTRLNKFNDFEYIMNPSKSVHTPKSPKVKCYVVTDVPPARSVASEIASSRITYGHIKSSVDNNVSTASKSSLSLSILSMSIASPTNQNSSQKLSKYQVPANEYYKRDDFALQQDGTGIALLGDWGYVGTFRYLDKSQTDQSKSSTTAAGNPGFASIAEDSQVSLVKFASGKVISKYHTAVNYMDVRVLQEIHYLLLLSSTERNLENDKTSGCSCLPCIDHIIQDEKVLLVLYRDIFVCDLTVVIATGFTWSKQPAAAAANFYQAGGLASRTSPIHSPSQNSSSVLAHHAMSSPLMHSATPSLTGLFSSSRGVGSSLKREGISNTKSRHLEPVLDTSTNSGKSSIQFEMDPISIKTYYLACVFSAIHAIHSFGICHRFLNSGCVYITNSGIPKVLDLRYAKKMNGSKSYTVCGDPLYLAPEVLLQKGYNYSVDLWSFGILAYELFEGKFPLLLTSERVVDANLSDNTNTNTELSSSSITKVDSKVVDVITAFKTMDLKFSAKSDSTIRDFITGLLNPDVELRLGYMNGDDVKNHPVFKNINWNVLGVCPGFPLEIQAAVDKSLMLDEAAIPPLSSLVFDQF